VKRITREIKERSFQFLDEADALKAVKLFNSTLKQNQHGATGKGIQQYP